MRLSFLLAATLWLSASLAGAAGPPTVDRSIKKEPAYRSKSPRYCLLVFGPQAKGRAWLVLDGETLHVDRKGAGDLTAAGNRVARKPGPDGGGFEVPELAVGGGKRRYKNLVVYWTPRPAGALEKDFLVEVLIDVDDGYCQHAVFRAAATRPEDAPVIHFGGPLAMLMSDVPPIDGPGSTVELAAAIGTRSPTGHLARVRHDRGLGPKRNLHPVAEVTFPGKAPGAAPVRLKIPLDQRCCNVRFFAEVRVPADAAPVPATLTLSFPDWAEGNVRSLTRPVRMGRPPSPVK